MQYLLNKLYLTHKHEEILMSELVNVSDLAAPDAAASDSQALNDLPNRESLEAYWMPYTGNRYFKENPLIVTSAQGCYLTTQEGNKVFDGLSGLWCCGMGHGRPEIIQAVTKGIQTLDFSPTFQVGNDLAFKVANKVKDLTPDGLDYVFFTNSGSDAADTALKMARAYW